VTAAARTLALVAAWIALVALLAEGGIRVLARSSDGLRSLSYSPRVLDDFDAIDSLEALMRSSLPGFQPFEDFAGFRTNSKGFRTPEYNEAKAAGTARIVILGDSFAFASGGTPYRLHWPVLLEATLRRDVGPEVELINLGVGGVGPRFELRLWQLEGSQLDADLVILAFCVGNDFQDGYKEIHWSVSPGDWLADRSLFVRVVRNRWRMRQLEPGVPEPTRPPGRDIAVAHSAGGFEVEGYAYDPDAPTFSESAFLRVVHKRMRLVKKDRREEFDLAFERVTSVLRQLRDEVDAGGAELVLVMIPEEYQVDPAMLALAARRHKDGISEYDVDLPQRRLAAFCAANDIPCIDLLPAFRSAGARESLYKRRDTHWNIAGNALAADRIAREVAGRLR
jgi:hypothetical protein